MIAYQSYPLKIFIFLQAYDGLNNTTMVLHPRYIKLKVAELSANIKKQGFKNVITKVISNNEEGASRMLKVFT